MASKKKWMKNYKIIQRLLSDLLQLITFITRPKLIAMVSCRNTPKKNKLTHKVFPGVAYQTLIIFSFFFLFACATGIHHFNAMTGLADSFFFKKIPTCLNFSSLSLNLFSLHISWHGAKRRRFILLSGKTIVLGEIGASSR